MQSKLSLYKMTEQVLRKIGESTDVLEGGGSIAQSTNSIVGGVYQAILEATSYVADYYPWAILQKDCTIALDPTITTYNLPTDFYSMVQGTVDPKTYYTFCDFVILKGGSVPQIKFDFSKSRYSVAPKEDFSFKYITNGVIYSANNIDIRTDGEYKQNDDYPIIDARPIVNYATHLMTVRYYKDKSVLGDDALRDFKISVDRAINTEQTYSII